MKRAALGSGVELQVLQVIVHDLAVTEADLGELAAADLKDLVNTPLLAGVAVVDRRVPGLGRLGARNRLHPP